MTDRCQPNESGRAPADRPRPSSESDGRPEFTAASGARDLEKVPTPGWVPTDDVIGPTHDRQVLVVGDTPTGLTLTCLLRTAGYDPVLANAADPPAVSRASFLSPAAMEVLGALDAGRCLLDSGVTIDGVAVGSTREGHSGETIGRRAGDAGRASPLVIPTPVLYRTLNDGMPPGTTALDRTVRSISAGEDGVAVRFDGGVREWFDLVVDAGTGTLRSGDRTDDDGRGDIVCQYETTVGGRTDGRIRDVWLPDGLGQRLPVSANGGTLVRITTAEPEPVIGERVLGTLGERSELPAVPGIDAFDRERVGQERLPEGSVPEKWWGHGRVAYCGRAACPAAPAAGVGVSSGIVDALGLVSVLSCDEMAVPEAVGVYAADRAARFDGVRRAATGSDRTPPVPEVATEPLRSLGALRGMALEPFFGTAPTAL